METKTNEVKVEEMIETANVETVETGVEQLTYDKIIRNMLADGCKRINGLKVKNVNYEEKENYTRVSFTLNKKVPGYVPEDNGVTWKLGLTDIIYVSLYAIAGAIKEDENLAWLANTILENPKALNLIFNGSVIDIIQQEVVAGVEFTNPFSSKQTPSVFDHDNILNHVVKFKLSQTGQRFADMLAMKTMGF